MKTTRRERRCAIEHFNEVHHTTLNPEGPGVVRIHLVPPVLMDGEIGASCAIINGQDIIPVNRSWSILLTEFIGQVNKYAGKPITEEEMERILTDTTKAVRKIYPVVSNKRLRYDVYRIMKTFRQIARGEAVDEEIDYCTIGEYTPFMRAPHRMDLIVSAMTRNGAWHCNQKCVHCYAANQPQAEENELGTEDWKRIIDKCRAAGIAQLTFTGGEPTLRADLPELIEYAKWFITRLNTNGILITESFAETLKSASLDSIQITFYSADEAVHNTLVGADRYADTLQWHPAAENPICAPSDGSIATVPQTAVLPGASRSVFLPDRWMTGIAESRWQGTVPFCSITLPAQHLQCSKNTSSGAKIRSNGRNCRKKCCGNFITP